MIIRLLDLFSGVGAMSLGLERTGGFKTVAFCEIDPFARRVLAKHWPGVPLYDDVRTLTAGRLAADGIAVDAICGGFPCQPHSLAGRRRASADDRDLWPEFARLIREIRPRWVLAENVPGIRSSEAGAFFAALLRDLAQAGYDAEWRSISAADVGAPHKRERVWIVAYPAGKNDRRRYAGTSQRQASESGNGSQPAPMAYPNRRGWGVQGDVGGTIGRAAPGQPGDGGALSQPGQPRLAIGEGTIREWAHATTTGTGWWAVESGLGRMVNEPADRVDRRRRLICIGNAVVPAIPELIGGAILANEAGTG